MVFFELPFPPSANNLFANAKKGGRVKTTEYKDWIKLAGYLLNRQQGSDGPFNKPVSVLIKAKKGGSARDLDNMNKPLLDLLQKHQVIKNDNWNHVVDIRICLADPAEVEPGHVLIVVVPA